MVSPSGFGSGAGGSGSLGAPLSLTQREVETSAWTETNKAALNIVPDSIALSFTQLSQQSTSTNTGYRAREDQPPLGHTLENVRVLNSNTYITDETWNAVYQGLIEQLPPGVLARFLEEQQKPLNEQEPSFAVAANVLKGSAKLLANLAIHSQSPVAGSLEEDRMQTNMINSLIAMRQSIINNSEVADKAEEYLQEQGANLPHHDELKDRITQIKSAAENLGSMNLTTPVDTTEAGNP